MTEDELDRRRTEIEARAALAYGAAINRRAANGGRYWALGAAIAAMALEPLREEIDARAKDEIEAAEREHYRSLGFEV